MRLVRFLLILGIAVLLAFAAIWLLEPQALLAWAAGVQREVQNAMAGSLRALRAGEATALLGLCGLTFTYGFVHAIGPGHGKFLLGATALSNRATLRRLAGLTLAASLAQAATAIALVLVGAGLVSLTSSALVALTDELLAPASYAAVGLIGAYIAARGARGLWRALAPAGPHDDPHEGHDHHAHGPDCGCGHSHGPSPDQVREEMSLREMAALVASIGLRPCTGALFLLVIAWGLGMLAAGMLATVAMSLGTAAFNLIVAGSGLGASAAVALLGSGRQVSPFLSPVMQLSAGMIVVAASAGMLLLYL
jgi:ABC-type nickel/cobalt efflux system permease component RcnA